MKYLSFIRSSEKYREAQPPAAMMEAMGKLIEKFTKEGALRSSSWRARHTARSNESIDTKGAEQCE